MKHHVRILYEVEAPTVEEAMKIVVQYQNDPVYRYFNKDKRSPHVIETISTVEVTDDLTYTKSVCA